MKILWVSFYTSTSAYAHQSRMVVPKLIEMGHEVTVFNLGDSAYPIQEINGVKILQTGLDPMGSDMLLGHFKAVEADIVITLNDLWAFRPEILKQIPVYPWLPVDHSPLPPRVRAVLDVCAQPLVMSRFGEKQLDQVRHNPFYVPHAYDETVFKPVDRRKAREALSIPQNAFWVSFVGVNDSIPSRKGIAELLIAWSAFARNHADASLYLHTSPMGSLSSNQVGGVNIPKLISSLGINSRQITIADEYKYQAGMPQQFLTLMYSASDVLILPSRGEGFGLPLLEAQACSTPVITTDFGAQKELCNSGWLIDGESSWSPHESFYLAPHVGSILERLEDAYDCPNMDDYRHSALVFAQQYEIKRVMDTYWRVALTAIESKRIKT